MCNLYHTLIADKMFNYTEKKTEYESLEHHYQLTQPTRNLECAPPNERIPLTKSFLMDFTELSVPVR